MLTLSSVSTNKHFAMYFLFALNLYKYYKITYDLLYRTENASRKLLHVN